MSAQCRRARQHWPCGVRDSECTSRACSHCSGTARSERYGQPQRAAFTPHEWLTAAAVALRQGHATAFAVRQGSQERPHGLHHSEPVPRACRHLNGLGCSRRSGQPWPYLFAAVEGAFAAISATMEEVGRAAFTVRQIGSCSPNHSSGGMPVVPADCGGSRLAAPDVLDER